MILKITALPMFFMALWLIPSLAAAHCDTLEGPVVKDAKVALEKGDITPILKWIGKNDEAEIRESFKKTMAVRAKGKEAKELADMYLFETLVRIHRAGEGAPYTGLKSGEVEPAIKEADNALESGSPDALTKMLTGEAADGIKKRFKHAKEAMRHKDESVEAGREFVKAYVEFTHYVEGLHRAAKGPSDHHMPVMPESHGH